MKNNYQQQLLLQKKSIGVWGIGYIQVDRSKVANQVFNLGGLDSNFRKGEIGKTIRDEFLPELKINFVHQDPDLRSYRVDFSKITEQLDFKPLVSLQDAIRDLISLHHQILIGDTDNKFYKNS